MNTIDFSLLETQGFVVLPNFLTNAEVNALKHDYVNSEPHPLLPSYKLTRVSHKIFKFILYKKIIETTEKIKKKTNINVDLVIPQARYYNNNISAIDQFHQDHESFYMLQQYYDYLNFWIPIKKPDPKKSGLTVIPYDKLKKINSDYASIIYNYGATRHFTDNKMTRLVDDNNGKEYLFPFNLEEIAVSPELNEGDLLLLRGDTIHKTQDNDTNRIAITTRSTNSLAMSHKDKFVEFGCSKKNELLTINHEFFNSVVTVFENNNATAIPAKDFFDNYPF